MMLKKIFVGTLIVLLSAANAFPQSAHKKDKYVKFSRNNKPTIELSYGLSDIRLNGDELSLANAGLVEMKLGFTQERDAHYGKDILKYRNNFLFLGYAASDNYASKNNPGIESDMWKFGLGHKEAYGVRLGSISIVPYNSTSFAWSKFNYLSNDDVPALNDFDGAFRFGSMTEGGINFQLATGFAIQPKYEIADIFPRHLFGKQLMSTVIEATGLFAIDGFTRAILHNNPVAGAFVNFILKNAYEYGFYRLRESQMNWPFTSVAPLRYSTIKLGFTFTF